jgi:hypothetical protein
MVVGTIAPGPSAEIPTGVGSQTLPAGWRRGDAVSVMTLCPAPEDPEELGIHFVGVSRR